MQEVTSTVAAVARPAAGDTPDDVAVRLEGVSKTYGGSEQPAVDDLSLEIRDGEFVTLLGPSGCGKTTTLRIVAGLETADAGTVRFGSEVMVDAARGISVRPDRRNVGMVFQAYAIWPHMTVQQNVAFPLRARKYPRNRIKQRVREALELVGLSGYESRPAPLLSGGQQQRVALARAIVTEPSVLLLDEPFSNLDVKLREQMRVEMKSLQQRVGVAVLFVTHDQTEALALSDRIAVMRGGVIEQQGAPQELYQEPATEFVRDFIGSTLLFNGVLREREASGSSVVALDGATDCLLRGRIGGAQAIQSGQSVHIGIRPEDGEVVPVAGPDASSGEVHGTVAAALFMGERIDYQVEVDGHGTLVLRGARLQPLERGARVSLRFAADGHSVWTR
jgi:iron(III) transport system ATP-binding protein